MGMTIDEADGNIDVFFYQGLQTGKGDFKGREMILQEFPELSSILETLNEMSKNAEGFQRAFKPLMSSCSKVTIEVYVRDRDGNEVGVKGEFEKDKDSDSTEAAAPDPDSTPDSSDCARD